MSKRTNYLILSVILILLVITTSISVFDLFIKFNHHSLIDEYINHQISEFKELAQVPIDESTPSESSVTDQLPVNKYIQSDLSYKSKSFDDYLQTAANISTILSPILGIIANIYLWINRKILFTRSIKRTRS